MSEMTPETLRQMCKRFGWICTSNVLAAADAWEADRARMEALEKELAAAIEKLNLAHRVFGDAALAAEERP
jgi:hypothetical protein